MTVRILTGDCRDVLATLDAASVDAVVTDPPYGLGFMGKDWDHEVPGVAFWEAMYRVMKPGAHLLAFGGTRTFHRIAVAIEDAGFEIRDTLMWMYGSGFPKSLDVSKAIDKARDDYPEIRVVVEFIRSAATEAGHNAESINAALGWGSAVAHHFLAPSRSNAGVPKWDQWLQLKDLLSFGDTMDAEVWRLNGRKGTPGDNWDKREVIGKAEWSNSVHHFVPGEDHTQRVNLDVTAPATPEAARWAGWGTALKPAYEPIILARKPLAGTVANNVLTHGTGALNIDGCRIGIAPEDFDGRMVNARKPSAFDATQHQRPGVTNHNPAGRWPANVVLDEDAAALLDAQSGVSTSKRADRGKGVPHYRNASDGAGGRTNDGRDAENWERYRAESETGVRGHSDTGGASRFFYVAKASRAERNAGLAGMPEQAVAQTYGLTAGGNTPQQTPHRHTPQSNSHPTVKPLALMRWLVRLVTPPGGVVLNPFMGSGSTGVACLREGVNFIGIELNDEYAEIARRRIIGDAPLFAALEVPS